ncbi:chitobiase/beta-hexosaminidase C-terminal domain-containing protein [Brevibacillus fluminis]|uniref:chitobiase/beta-hexosaminidase C-terminal domain-containing protein n=1 Tax=Brevibacillus fluminis TaxID=511487 RepID=UPI003F88C650
MGLQGYIYVSDDGITWEEKAAPTGTSISLATVTYADGYFYVGGTNETLITSPDGSNWTTEITGGSTKSITSIRVGDGKVVAAGSSGLVKLGGALTKPTVATPTANPAGGEVASGTTVALSTTTVGASIYYTTNGSTPTTSSTPYSSPIPITSAVTLKAIAVKAGMADSAVMSEDYTIKPQVATPTANPAGGEVAAGTTVALSTTTDGASIYYTTDGATPTSSSTLYSSPIPITGAVTLKAIAVKSGMTDSAVMSEDYTIKPQVATPTANPAGGEVAAGTTVALSTATDGASIYYTTDGATPTSSSTLYSIPIPITGAVTLKAIAVKSGMTDSAVMSEDYTIKPQVATPTANPAGGEVASGTTVALSTVTDGATIYYTTDGATPTSSSTPYSSPITVSSAMTIKAIAVKSGMIDSDVMSESYTIAATPQAAKPIATPAGGEVASGTKVTLGTSTAGATIHYTVDGSTPTASSPSYTGEIEITGPVTIKAIAVKAGMTDSDVMSESYTIAATPQAAKPIATPAGGEVAAGTTVALSTVTDGATIYYTTDGATPTSSSTPYSSPITVSSAMTIKAIAVKSGMIDSDVMSESYTIAATPQAAKPIATPAGGEVASGTKVTLGTSTAGATIHYTVDGSTPTASSPSYTGEIEITGPVTIKAIAVKAGMTDSDVMSESYTIAATPQAAKPIATPAGGEVAAGTTVALSTVTDGATIYYTTDGATPTSSSTPYSSPITVSSAMTIKAIAVKSGMIDSDVMSESYTIAATPQAAKPIATPAGGEVASGTKVTLGTSTAGATIHYTVDGSTPTASSPSYTGEIEITGPVTIKAIAVKAGMTDSDVMSESYTIAATPQAAKPIATPAGGEVASGTTVALSTVTDGATIYYTTDGATPTSSSTPYSSPITVSSAMTIKAIAVKSGMIDSDVMSESYTIAATPQAAKPIATPAGGEVASGTKVTLGTSTAGATIHYTVDGSTPTASSPSYTGEIEITGPVTIKAIAIKAGMTDSDVMSESYTIAATPQAAKPIATPAGGEVASGTKVTLGTSTAGATIHYTVDGSTPTASSPSYTGEIEITGPVTIKAIAIKAGMTDSDVMSESYTITAIPQAAKPTATPAGGEVAAGTKVALSTTTAGATIYYTTDGATPTSSSTPYSSPITVSSAMTIKAIAVKPGMTDSDVMSESYTIAATPQAAKPIATPAGGEVAAGTTVALSTATAGATIYYTTDGATPTSSSTPYSSPITVSSAMTIKAIAVKPGMTDSDVMSESYSIRVPTIEITSVKTPAPITDLENGTAKTVASLGLPHQVEVSVNNGATLQVDVDWAVASANYDPNRKERQSFTVTGNLVNLPHGITNPQNLVATIQVTVKAAITKDKEIVRVTNPAPITGLPNGTSKRADALGLPSQVEVTLDDGTFRTVNVKWDVTAADYDPKKKDAQRFSVTGELVKLPDGVQNSKNLTVTVEVSVDAASTGDIIAVENPNDITGLANGTPKKADALGLPEQVRVTLEDGTNLMVDVKWDISGADYDPKNKKAQWFTVNGALVKLPKGVTNSKNYTATVQVQVNAKDDGEERRAIVKVTQPSAITDVANGTRKTAAALGLPKQIKATLDDDSKISVDVGWDVEGADYDPDSSKKQHFTVKGVLIDLPPDVENPKNLDARISVTVNAAPREDRGDDNNDGSDKGGNSDDSGKSEEREKESTRQAKVGVGSEGSLSDELEITRKTSSGGKQVDEVVFDQKKVKEILGRAGGNDNHVVRIVIDDIPDDPADETSVKVPGSALKLMKDNQVALEIQAGEVVITVPKEMVAALPGEDLYFRVVPIVSPNDKQTVVSQTLDAEAVKQAAGGQDVEVVGKPMVIETNYRNFRTKVTFPLDDVQLPADPVARQAFLSTLAVYVQHSDGDKELKTGKITYDEHGTPAGIEIEITKFSTFTILSLKGKQNHVLHNAYMTGYPDQTFQPNRILTRAEMAAVLAKLLQEQNQEAVTVESSAFADVLPNHWAASAIQQVKNVGLMNGDENGLFHPNAKVTRGEMATILAKWKQLGGGKAESPFADTKGHWAAASIAVVVEQGLMKGYGDGTFRPNQGLTRAEAATLFNRMTGRGPLAGITKPIWSDVPIQHWAYGEIVEATIPHAAIQQVDGTETFQAQQ